LSNKNENTTVLKSKKNLDLNKLLGHSQCKTLSQSPKYLITYYLWYFADAAAYLLKKEVEKIDSKSILFEIINNFRLYDRVCALKSPMTGRRVGDRTPSQSDRATSSPDGCRRYLWAKRRFPQLCAQQLAGGPNPHLPTAAGYTTGKKRGRERSCLWSVAVHGAASPLKRHPLHHHWKESVSTAYRSVGTTATLSALKIRQFCLFFSDYS